MTAEERYFYLASLLYRLASDKVPLTTDGILHADINKPEFANVHPGEIARLPERAEQFMAHVSGSGTAFEKFAHYLELLKARNPQAFARIAGLPVVAATAATAATAAAESRPLAPASAPGASAIGGRASVSAVAIANPPARQPTAPKLKRRKSAAIVESIFETAARGGNLEDLARDLISNGFGLNDLNLLEGRLASEHGTTDNDWSAHWIAAYDRLPVDKRADVDALETKFFEQLTAQQKMDLRRYLKSHDRLTAERAAAAAARSAVAERAPPRAAAE